jgi:hypothetical protein
MIPPAHTWLKIGVGRTTAGGQRTRRADPIGWGIAGSAALHILAALLLIIIVPWSIQPPPEEEMVVPVDLVQLSDVTRPPEGLEKAGQPQQTAPEAAKPDTSEPQPTSHIAASSPKTTPPTNPTSNKKPPTADDINTLLALVEKSHQPVTPESSARPRNAQRATNGTTTGLDLTLGQQGIFAKSVPGPQGTIGVRDFIRAQIERRWEFNVHTPGANDAVVSIHILLAADGSVERADIVDQQRYTSDVLFREIADSAHRAVLLSAPLQIPAGQYETAKDMTLNFSPHDVLR